MLAILLLLYQEVLSRINLKSKKFCIQDVQNFLYSLRCRIGIVNLAFLKFHQWLHLIQGKNCTD